jgi:ppGpp synthetase/RelA/SpoT-type nucleotidyltranferase/DNA-binding transcriptional MerR regulator
MVERQEKRRRRRRQVVAGCCCLTLSVLLTASPPSDAFTAISKTTTTSLKEPLRRNIVLFASETALVLESPSASEYDFATPVELPPWLKRLESYTEDDAMIHLDWLEYALLEEGFTFEDIRDIVQAVQQTCQGDVTRMVGSIDFLRLALQLKDDGDTFCTKQVLLASVLHFSDCITVRQTGVYEMVKRAIHGRQENNNSHRALAPAREQRVQPEVESYDDITRSLISATRRQELYTEAYEEYGKEVTRIARDAARVKRAEILAHAVLDVGRKPSKEESSRLRGLLLSVMDDWRALAIRAVACLYRLEGILYDAEQAGSAEYVHLSQETVKATREALHVYAPLAQRLGMQRLKAKLEDRAFRIMYRRQYGVVSTLYKENGAEMALLSSDLSSTIEQVLRQTPSLMEQLEDLKVTSRVKEPYSLWKKLLKLRHRGLKSSSSAAPSLEASTGALVESATEAQSTMSSELSLVDVQDGIAVRVILTARKWSPDEPEEITRNRERLLCYYVQKILSNYWPAVDDSRVKDYIRSPKPNGYQSLHYTSVTTNDGKTWPFEVQVRSLEMHRIAEYGVAAHWDYKLGNQKIELLSPASSITPSTEVTRTALPASETSPAEDSYIDALVTARKDLVQQRVFVFFAGSSAIDNMGHLLSLPVGARVSDAIDELKKQLDLDMFADVDDSCVLRNGRAASPDEYIGNGDVLLITL